MLLCQCESKCSYEIESNENITKNIEMEIWCYCVRDGNIEIINGMFGT